MDRECSGFAHRWTRYCCSDRGGGMGLARAVIPVIADLDELYPGVEELLENIDYLVVSRDFHAGS